MDMEHGAVGSLVQSSLRGRLTVVLAAFVAVAAGCGPVGKEADAPLVDSVRQGLGTSWELWSGSVDGGVIGSDPAVSGHYTVLGGGYVYVANNGGVEYGPKYYTAGSWAQVNSSPRAANARAAAALLKPGYSYCSVVGWRDPSSANFVWGVENLAFDSCYPPTTVATLSGTIDSAPAIAAYVRSVSGTDYYHYWVFTVRASDGALHYNHFVGTSPTSGTWGGWAAKTDGAGRSGSSVAAISRGENSVDIFVTGTDDVPYTRNIAITYPGGTETVSWTAWTGLGGAFSSDPAVGSKSATNMTLCGTGTDSVPYCKDYSSGNWSNYRGCGGSLSGAPAVTNDQTDVWVMGRGTDNKLYARVCN